MATKTKNNAPNWLDNFTDVSKKIETEPFAEVIEKADLKDFAGYLVVATRPQGSKKINFALRIEDDINNSLEECNGSKNAVINALLKYAINDLRKKNKTLHS